MSGFGLLIVAVALAAEPVASQSVESQPVVEPPSELVARVCEAVEQGLEVVQRGADNYPQNRDCFSCHHQALPVFATRTVLFGDRDSNTEFVDRQLEFTRDSFASRLESLRRGKRFGGRAATASYALWTFHVAGCEPDDVTAALVESLLKTQESDGRWQPPSRRPPLEESAQMCTTLAVIGLRSFADDDTDDRVTEAVDRAKSWAESTALETHEDRVGHLWLLTALDPEDARISSAQDALLSRQREDGGWGQTDEMDPDAYATGQAVYVLMQSGLAANHPAVTRGVHFLLDEQEEDGSWHVVTRSEPVQKWFDNGDPHGEDQFISIAATSWATAALAEWAGQFVP